MPNEPTPGMRALIAQAETEIDELMGALELGSIDPDEWEDEFQQVLTRNHLGSWMLGQASATMGTEELLSVSQLIAAQLPYLRNFKLVVQTADEFMAGWYARAEMYASAMNQTYWSGRMKVWPLPAMPGQGTICMSNCRCSWREASVNIADGNGKFYWELDPFVAEGQHCQTCEQRHEEWYPVEVINGELQI